LGTLRERNNLKVPRRRRKDDITLYGRVGMDKSDLLSIGASGLHLHKL